LVSVLEVRVSKMDGQWTIIMFDELSMNDQ